MSGGQSKIEWTERTWNPTVGCTKMSQGCKNCYAEGMAKRLHAMGTPGYENGFRLTLLPNRLDEPRNRKSPTVYFVNSMSDLFHEDVPVEFIAKVWAVMMDTPRHTYQILTKRPWLMSEVLTRPDFPVLPNVWLGASVEDGRVLGRLDALRKVPAAIRFVSLEPLIGSVADGDLTGIHWAIVGGESGPRSREMKPEWVDEIEAMCARSGTVFFFKQWGGKNKKAAGRLLHGRTYDDMPLGI